MLSSAEMAIFFCVKWVDCPVDLHYEEMKFGYALNDVMEDKSHNIRRQSYQHTYTKHRIASEASKR